VKTIEGSREKDQAPRRLNAQFALNPLKEARPLGAASGFITESPASAGGAETRIVALRRFSSYDKSGGGRRLSCSKRGGDVAWRRFLP
jgi:hypothetical protein